MTQIMRTIKPGIFIFILIGTGLLGGCASTYRPPTTTENLIVPPVSSRIGVLRVKQVFELQQATAMNAIKPGIAQPEIHLPYDPTKDGPPPAEALQRVALQPWGTVTQEVSEMETDPNTGETTWVTCWETFDVDAEWGQKVLTPGTRISVSSIEVYGNSHVYRGRVLDGPAHNCFVLLVVPVGDSAMPTLDKLEVEDLEYLIPVVATSEPATKP